MSTERHTTFTLSFTCVPCVRVPGDRNVQYSNHGYSDKTYRSVASRASRCTPETLASH